MSYPHRENGLPSHSGAWQTYFDDNKVIDKLFCEEAYISLKLVTMINHLTLLSIASLFFSVSFSQISSGISAGLAFSDVKGATQLSSDNSFKVGYQATFFVEYSITKNLGIRPSLQVTQKGYKSVLSNGHRPFFCTGNVNFHIRTSKHL